MATKPIRLAVADAGSGADQQVPASAQAAHCCQIANEGLDVDARNDWHRGGMLQKHEDKSGDGQARHHRSAMADRSMPAKGKAGNLRPGR